MMGIWDSSQKKRYSLALFASASFAMYKGLFLGLQDDKFAIGGNGGAVFK